MTEVRSHHPFLLAVATSMMSIVGCRETHDLDRIDASIDAPLPDVPFDVPGLDVAVAWPDVAVSSVDPIPTSCESSTDPRCAYDVLAALDADLCNDIRACGFEVSDEVCAAYLAPEGGQITELNEGLVLAVRLGRASVDVEAARCWLDANLSCGDAPTCGRLFVPVGERHEGDLCVGDVDCDPTHRCVVRAGSGRCGVGRCEARLPDGSECVIDPIGQCRGPACHFGLAQGPCVEGSVCTDRACRRVVSDVDATLGQRCDPLLTGTTVSFRDCGVGLLCRRPIDPGGPQECVALPRVGESCFDAGWCEIGARCAARDSHTLDYVCEPRGAVPGVPCEQCFDGPYDVACGERGTCERTSRGLGDLCSRGRPCREGGCAWMDLEGRVRRCMPTDVPNGQACAPSSFDPCAHGVCCDGVCRSVEELGASSSDVP